MRGVLHFCGMLSRVSDTPMHTVVPQDSRWSGHGPIRSLADMPDSDTDRIEYLSRLGTVLQLARRHIKMSQETAAQKMGVNPSAFTRWEDGRNSISAYDLVRLIRLYDFDPDLAVNPPSSKVEIRRRLGAVSASVRRAAKRAQLRPLPASGGVPE